MSLLGPLPPAGLVGTQHQPRLYARFKRRVAALPDSGSTGGVRSPSDSPAADGLRSARVDFDATHGALALDRRRRGASGNRGCLATARGAGPGGQLGVLAPAARPPLASDGGVVQARRVPALVQPRGD